MIAQSDTLTKNVISMRIPLCKTVSRQRIPKWRKKRTSNRKSKQKESLRNVFPHKKRGNSRNALFTMCATAWDVALCVYYDERLAAAATWCNERENWSFCRQRDDALFPERGARWRAIGLSAPRLALVSSCNQYNALALPTPNRFDPNSTMASPRI